MPSAIIEHVPAGAPPKVIGPATKRATRPTNKLPQSLIDSARIPDPVTFDHRRHLAFEPPKNIYTMKDIGLEGHGISPHAVSEPFPLFTKEAIRQMRAEVFSDQAMEHCQYSSSFTKNMIRGIGPDRAPFIYDAWHSPEVLAKISEVAGIDLIPIMDYDVGNTNVSIDDSPKDIITTKKPSDDDVTAVAWHYDSVPFVCVLMLSDCTNMVGGETAVRTASGDIMKVRGPTMGTAVVMQGRYIEHQALKAFGGRERITMVTSFRPKSPFVKDETVLTGVRGISDLSGLYTQYSRYRLEVLEERIRHKLKTENRRQVTKRPFDIPEMRKFLTEQKQFIESMIEEIYEVDDD
ncbi:hypothetical protein FQN54_001848 [Arachnomyces sp. PD_36]|nr:hypothetical protein FQN54_001848 [Arachnomyces sp. PD_36]